MGKVRYRNRIKSTVILVSESSNELLYRHTAVIHLNHNLSPTILPSFMKLEIPAITTLHFRETECDSGLLKIYKQEDSWTLEGKKRKKSAYNKERKEKKSLPRFIQIGLLQSVPLISFWYNHVLRVVMGKLLTTTGDILDSAVNHAQKMSMQSREIQRISQDLAIENLGKLDEYKSDLKINYLEGLKNWKESYHHQDQDEAEGEDYGFTPIKESGTSGLYIEDRRKLYLKQSIDEDEDY
jgi:hypothetical protein